MAQSNLGKINLGKFNLDGGAEAVAGTTITVPTGSLSLTGFAPVAFLGDVTVTPGLGSLLLSAFAPQIEIGIQPPAGALTLTGFAPVPYAVAFAEPPVGALTLTGFAPSSIVQVAPVVCTTVAAHASDKTLEWDDEPVERLGT